MKIMMVCVGDARKSVAWSGVPKRLYEELIRIGHEVVPIDISADFLWHWCGVAFNRIIRRVYLPYRRVAFCNTRFGLYLSGRCIKRALKKNEAVDLIFSTTFSIDCSATDIPCVLLHDWTEGYAILREGSVLNSCEEVSERNQAEVIRASKVAFAIYPDSCKYIKELIGPSDASKVHYVCNPINSEIPTKEWVEDRLCKGAASKRVLVVGGAFYQRNVECVIAAVDKLKRDDIVVDVIGRNSAETQPQYCKVNFYGYLDKDDPDQKSLYLGLFKTARCLVNIRKCWGGGSSVAEAMYNYLPIIVGRYPEFVSLYGEDDSRFGSYCEEENANALAERLQDLLSLDEDKYVWLCKSAHALVEYDTYKRLVEEMFLNLTPKTHEITSH